MTEEVIRHRGESRDENGEIIAPESNVPLTPIEVIPGGGSEFVERNRDGETTAFTVYFWPGTDITNDDTLTVRGDKFGIVVNDWMVGGRGVVEVLCTRGRG